MKDKLIKLQEVKSKLKSEFVGLDSIIDKVIDAITPWYLTPEVLERPTVVSLWGLTGTGKTSLIRKLINNLGISEKSLFFDCGEQGGETDSKLFSEKLDDLFESSKLRESDPRYSQEDLKRIGIELDQTATTRMDPLDYTFVFDEFQYLRTKDPGTGAEESRPEGRAIWSLMDSGLVDINKYHYKIKSLMDYVEDLEFFSDEHPGTKIKDGRFDKSLTPILKQQLSYYRWSDEDYSDFDDPEETKKKENLGYHVIFDEDFSFLMRKLNILQKGLGFEVADKLMGLKSLSEFINCIKNYIGLISKPKIINCSKSLVFVLGNLDEAFDLTGEDMDPDIDADVYHEMTSKVNCMDIKIALRRRFRDEQIGRMGNNIIIYPSLRRKDFVEIIDRETTRITKKFKETSGIDITLSQKFKDLIYSEGCFPIQGVRPLFSTINSLISPLLSLILTSETKEKNLIIDVSGDNFSIPRITVNVKTSKEKIVGSKEIELNLGTLRSPERCKKIGLQAIHEASHAVLYYLLTGKYPSAIVASNIFGDGGYMMNAIDTDSSTESILDLENDIIVSLAGYYGEREFFEPSYCSLGGSSDISNVWTKLRGAFYNSGVTIPMFFSEPGVSDQNDGLPYGFPVTENPDIHKELLEFFEKCCEKTKKLIRKEAKVIGHIANYLIKNRSMKIDDFKTFIKEYGSEAFNKKLGPDENYYTDNIWKRIN